MSHVLSPVVQFQHVLCCASSLFRCWRRGWATSSRGDTWGRRATLSQNRTERFLTNGESDNSDSFSGSRERRPFRFPANVIKPEEFQATTFWGECSLLQGVVRSGEPAHVHQALPGLFEPNCQDRSGQRQKRADGLQGGQSVRSAKPRRDDPERWKNRIMKKSFPESKLKHKFQRIRWVWNNPKSVWDRPVTRI